MPPHEDPGRTAGAATVLESAYTLLELLVALALSGIIAASAIEAARGLKHELDLVAGRMVVLRAAALTRRLARVRSESFMLTTSPGSGLLSVVSQSGSADAGTQTLELPPGVIVSRATAGGQIRFRADGSADNATITLTSVHSAASRTVIINQRGMIR